VNYSLNSKALKGQIKIRDTYNNPLYVLVGRWTGSMGERMAIGFDGMSRAKIIGTEMNRLAGEIKTINLLNSDFAYQLSFEKLYHINGALQEKFVPFYYVDQISLSQDDYINYAAEMIKEDNNR
jgi:Periplasmic protease